METIRFSTPQDQTIPSVIQNLQLFSSFQNVLFTFDNSLDNDLSTYQYELYEETEIVNTNAPPYQLVSSPTTLRSGTGNSSVLAIPVTGSTVSIEGVEEPKNYFGRVRALDTTGNVGPWTALTKTDQSTPLIDEQFIVSLTASRIKAGEIESAAITLGGANPLETIIRSKTYVTSSGQEGWYIDGAGEFSLGGPEGINYNGGSITIGSDVQVTANVAADSISVGSGLNQLNINDAINGGNGGMTLGQGLNNYWYSNGNFRVGNATSYVIWNGSTLSVVGGITSTTGRIGPFDITPSSLISQGYSPRNFMKIENFGDVTISSQPNSGPHLNMIHRTDLVGEYILVQREGVTGRYAIMGSPTGNPNGMEFGLVDNSIQRFLAKTDGTVFASGNISGGSINSGSYIAAGSTGITHSGSVSASNWFRSSGATGWYSETYGGGIWMTDTSTVRVYGDKNFYTGGTIVSPTALFNSENFEIGANVAIKRAFSVNDKRFMSFINASDQQAGSIEYDGSSTKVRYNVTSDLRIKTNVRKINSALLKVNQFNPVTFNYIDASVDHDGFLAQELYEVYKNPITKPDKEEDYWMMDYSSLTPILTAAIQELSKKVEYLENKIKNM